LGKLQLEQTEFSKGIRGLASGFVPSNQCKPREHIALDIVVRDLDNDSNAAAEAVVNKG
jgi:hypothetical protein